MGLEDWAIVGLILLALWTFVPRHLRHAIQSGLGPSIDAAAQEIRGAIRAGGRLLTALAYRGLLGVPIPGSVKDSGIDAPIQPIPGPPQSSEITSSRGADGQTDKTDTAVSTDPRECTALQLDKSKSNLIKILVYNGWNVGDIRAAVKGENGAIGAEVQAARGEGNTSDPDVHITPIAGRMTRREYFPDELDLAYKPPD